MVRNVVDLPEAVQVTAGFSHTCAVTKTKQVFCWGANSEGQLGNPAIPIGVATPTPGLVPSLNGIVQASSYREHNCAINELGQVFCWGSNTSFALGTIGIRTPTPLLVGGLSTSRSIVIGKGFSCARALSGTTLLCWGGNINGELGDGMNTSRPTPMPVLFP